MAPSTRLGIDRKTFQALAAEYRDSHAISVSAVQSRGRVVMTSDPADPPDTAAWRQSRQLAVSESLRWGDPSVIYAPDHHLIWAVPLMYNAEVRGGLVAAVPETRLFPRRDGRAAIDVRKACADLRRLAERYNLTNAALLKQRREQYRHEQLRAEAIHELKLASSFDLRRAYLRDEPELIAAIRAGDRGAARAVLNRILSAIHYHTGERFELTKSFFMELVATACRTAVEAGGDPEQLLGTNFASIAELSRIDSLENLAPWLHQTLERILDSLYRHRFSARTALLARALDYLQQHFAENIGRDDVARIAHLSPSHFSRLFRQYTGQTFTEMLVRLRIQRAAELLSQTDKPIALVAAESGFSDQSHFTKTFGKIMGLTPRQFRKRQRDSAERAAAVQPARSR